MSIEEDVETVRNTLDHNAAWVTAAEALDRIVSELKGQEAIVRVEDGVDVLQEPVPRRVVISDVLLRELVAQSNELRRVMSKQ